jgi:hypothetical protein
MRVTKSCNLCGIKFESDNEDDLIATIEAHKVSPHHQSIKSKKEDKKEQKREAKLKAAFPDLYK